MRYLYNFIVKNVIRRIGLYENSIFFLLRVLVIMVIVYLVLDNINKIIIFFKVIL